MSEPELTREQRRNLRERVIDLYVNRQSEQAIAKKLDINQRDVRYYILDYLHHEGRISPLYVPIVSCFARAVEKRIAKGMKPEDAADELLMPESAVRIIADLPVIGLDPIWIHNCAYNFVELGYKPSEITIPEGAPDEIRKQIIEAMKDIKLKGENTMAVSTTPVQKTASAVSPKTTVSAEMEKRGYKTREEVVHHSDEIQAFLTTALNTDDKKAYEIACVGKYYLLGHDLPKIAGLMAMDRNIAGVQHDLDAFMQAEDFLRHPEKQANIPAPKKTAPKPAPRIVSKMFNGHMRNLPADIDAFIAEYRAGATTTELSKKWKGVSAATASEIMRTYKVPMHRTGTLKQDAIDATVRMYRSGMAPVDIAKELGISANTVYNRLSQAGISVRNDNAEKRAKEIAKIESAMHATPKKLDTVPAAKPTAPAPAPEKAETVAVAVPTKEREKFGDMDFFLDMYMEIAKTPGVTAIDFMRWMLAIEDSDSEADKSAVAKKMVSVIADSKNPGAIDTAKLLDTVEIYVEAENALAKL